MNVYDTANELAQEIKKSEEYVNFKMAKEALGLNPELKKKIEEFDLTKYEVQLTTMQTGKTDEEKNKKLQDLYSELIENQEAKKYLDAETQFNILFSDVNKIIGEAVRDVFEK